MRTFGRNSFKLSTPGYESSPPKEKEEEESFAEDNVITENILFKEFNVKPEHFEVFQDDDTEKWFVKCIPCDMIIKSISRASLTKHYTSKNHEKSMSSVAVDKRKQAIDLLKELAQNQNSITFGKHNLWGCLLCDEKDTRRVLGTNCSMVKKHFLSKHEIVLPPKKAESPPETKVRVVIPEKKREREPEPEEGFDELFESTIDKIVENEARKKLKDEQYINNLVSENCGFFDDLFQKTQVDKFLAQSYARISSKK